AGMTLAEALSKLDAPAPASSANFFAGFDDWMEAEAVATRAGMTLAEALSKLDAPAPASSANFFAGFDDWMEA
ncbi:hypothetical protein CNY89_30035, partial [Amaricoccus sp. HAR-UPW-R2A-40]